MSKPIIPAVPPSAAGQGRVKFDTMVKESIEKLTGQRGGRIQELAADATLADVIAKVNEVIRRLQ